MDFHTEKLAEAMWRAWCKKHGGDVEISWLSVATKNEWRKQAMTFLDTI